MAPRKRETHTVLTSSGTASPLPRLISSIVQSAFRDMSDVSSSSLSIHWILSMGVVLHCRVHWLPIEIKFTQISFVNTMPTISSKILNFLILNLRCTTRQDSIRRSTVSHGNDPTWAFTARLSQTTHTSISVRRSALIHNLLFERQIASISIKVN